MSHNEKGTIWSADPHTIAKITILETYLTSWFQILGRKMKGKSLVYVDGFAGPGNYTNYPKGSPTAALTAVLKSFDHSGGSWTAVDVHCVFIEQDKKRFEHLERHLIRFKHTHLLIHLEHGTFEERFKAFVDDNPEIISVANPMFVFIDPFGATGASFETVSNILKKPISEVLVNFDADGVARIFQAGEDADHERILNEIFGVRKWDNVFHAGLTHKKLTKFAVDLYIELLHAIPVKYVFPFEMQDKSGTTEYYLIFASQHPRGLEKMKEAMKKIDRSGLYRFCSAHANQEMLFNFDDPIPYAETMRNKFRGTSVSSQETIDYALLYTPFINPKAMLRFLEHKGFIVVHSKDPRRRRGTFKEATMDRIEFKGLEELT